MNTQKFFFLISNFRENRSAAFTNTPKVFIFVEESFFKVFKLNPSYAGNAKYETTVSAITLVRFVFNKVFIIAVI